MRDRCSVKHLGHAPGDRDPAGGLVAALAQAAERFPEEHVVAQLQRASASGGALRRIAALSLRVLPDTVGQAVLPDLVVTVRASQECEEIDVLLRAVRDLGEPGRAALRALAADSTVHPQAGPDGFPDPLRPAKEDAWLAQVVSTSACTESDMKALQIHRSPLLALTLLMLVAPLAGQTPGELVDDALETRSASFWSVLMWTDDRGQALREEFRSRLRAETDPIRFSYLVHGLVMVEHYRDELVPVEPLRRALGHENEFLRLVAATAVAEISPGSAEALLPELVEGARKTKDWALAEAYVRAIGRAGEPGLVRLRELAADSSVSGHVSGVARQELRRAGAEQRPAG